MNSEQQDTILLPFYYQNVLQHMSQISFYISIKNQFLLRLSYFSSWKSVSKEHLNFHVFQIFSPFVINLVYFLYSNKKTYKIIRAMTKNLFAQIKENLSKQDNLKQGNLLSVFQLEQACNIKTNTQKHNLHLEIAIIEIICNQTQGINSF